MFEMGSIGVLALFGLAIIVLNAAITVLIFRQASKILFPDATEAISKGMTALGEKSGYVRAEKAMEKAITGDILDQFPEVLALLEHLSPETADMIHKNPQMAINLIQRYKPLIDQYLPLLTGGKSGSAKTEYDL